LYLNKDSFIDEENEILRIAKVAEDEGIDIVLVHEEDFEKGSFPI